MIHSLVTSHVCLARPVLDNPLPPYHPARPPEGNIPAVRAAGDNLKADSEGKAASTETEMGKKSVGERLRAKGGAV